MKKHPIFLILVLFSLSIGSCKYDYILPVEVGPISDVKFSTQIAPIFSTDDKCTACHKTGGTAPDLTAENAYAQIADLINLTTPEESKIYAYPAPSTNTHTRKKYTEVEAATILQWIKEGAKNN